MGKDTRTPEYDTHQSALAAKHSRHSPAATMRFQTEGVAGSDFL